MCKALKDIFMKTDFFPILPFVPKMWDSLHCQLYFSLYTYEKKLLPKQLIWKKQSNTLTYWYSWWKKGWIQHKIIIIFSFYFARTSMRVWSRSISYFWPRYANVDAIAGSHLYKICILWPVSLLFLLNWHLHRMQHN